MPFRQALAAATLTVLCLVSTGAAANPALAGTWNGTLTGNPITVTFDGKGGGQVDGRPIRYQVVGPMLVVEDQGQVNGYSYQVQGGTLTVMGGPLPGPLTLTRGQPGAAAPAAVPGRTPDASGRIPGVRPELLGKWCKAASFSANAGGGSQSSACFELMANGTYTYGSQRSASAYAPGAYGGTTASGGDAGRWSATDGSITASSRDGSVTTYRLEKLNHRKTGEPMLCLDGDCYTTYWKKAPW